MIPGGASRGCACRTCRRMREVGLLGPRGSEPAGVIQTPAGSDSNSGKAYR